MIDNINFENNIFIKNFISLNNDEKVFVLEMRNNDNVRNFMYNKNIIELDNHIKFIENLNNDDNNIYFVVYHDSNIIGVISLTEINNKLAFLGIYKNPFNKNSKGEYLINTIKKIAFDNLGLNEIIAEVISENTNAINFYKKHGFIYLNSEKKYNKFINDYENIEIFTFKKEFFKDEL